MFLMIISIIYSAALYFIPLAAFTNGILDLEGNAAVLWDPSIVTYYALLITATTIVMYDTRFYNLIGVGFSVFNIGFIFLILIIVELMNSAYMVSGIIFDSIDNLLFWLVLMLTSGVALVPFFILRSVEFFFLKSVVNNVNKGTYHQDFQQKKYEVQLEEMYKYKRSVAKFKRIYNTGNYKADNYAGKKMADIVKSYKEAKNNNIE